MFHAGNRDTGHRDTLSGYIISFESGLKELRWISTLDRLYPLLRHLGAVQAVSLTSKDSIYDYLHPSGGERGGETPIREREREMVDGGG